MELTIAQKLDALLKLQQIDSKLDELVKVRGDLPEEVQDLEDEIAGFETRVSNFRRTSTRSTPKYLALNKPKKTLKN